MPTMDAVCLVLPQCTVCVCVCVGGGGGGEDNCLSCCLAKEDYMCVRAQHALNLK